MGNYLSLYNKLKSELTSLEEKKASDEKNFEISHNNYNTLYDRINEIRDDIAKSKTRQENFIWTKEKQYFNKFGYNTLYTLCLIVLIVTFTTSLLGLTTVLIYNGLALSLGIGTALAIYPKLKKRAIEKLKGSGEYLDILKNIDELAAKKDKLMVDQNNLYKECARLESSISDTKGQISDKHQEIDNFIQAILGNASHENLTYAHNKEESSKENEKPLIRIKQKN